MLKSNEKNPEVGFFFCFISRIRLSIFVKIYEFYRIMSFFLEDIDNFLDKASKVRYSNFRVFSYEVGPVREKFSLDKKRYSNCISSAALVDITGFYWDRSGKGRIHFFIYKD